MRQRISRMASPTPLLYKALPRSPVARWLRLRIQSADKARLLQRQRLYFQIYLLGYMRHIHSLRLRLLLHILRNQS
jgi:hypothetical protein